MSPTPENTTQDTKIKKVKHRAKRASSMRIYLKKLAKENVHNKLQLSFGAVDKLEHICDHLIEKITQRAAQVMLMKKSRTLNANCMQGAISLELPPLLAKRCDDVGVQAVLKLSS
jgi:Na+/phosphate symporter